MLSNACLRDDDPEWAHEIVEALYQSAMRRVDQISAKEPESTVLLSMVKAKSEIGTEEVRRVARRRLGFVPEVIGEAAVGKGAYQLLNRIILNASQAVQNASEDAWLSEQDGDLTQEVRIRVTRQSIRIEGVYTKLSDCKSPFEE